MVCKVAFKNKLWRWYGKTRSDEEEKFEGVMEYEKYDGKFKDAGEAKALLDAQVKGQDEVTMAQRTDRLRRRLEDAGTPDENRQEGSTQTKESADPSVWHARGDV